MAALGAFTFVLHTHMPYARKAGRWPHGEEWIHEAMAETYIPLLDALHRLQKEQVPYKLTINLTPILLEQLADEDVQTNFMAYVDGRILAAEQDEARFLAEENCLTEEKCLAEERSHFAKLASGYRDMYRSVRSSFVEDYGKNLVGAFGALQEAGLIEIITCAATHGYLPLLDRDESIQLQLKTGIESYMRHFGRSPKAIWLPECAYRPAFLAEDGRERMGLETFLERNNLSLFFSEAAMIETAHPTRSAADDGGLLGLMRKHIISLMSRFGSRRRVTTFLPYHVADSRVCVIGRDRRTSMQVWSAESGYPGDFDYREFHKKDGNSGLQYWRVTSDDAGLDAKEVYDRNMAAQKVEQHVDHFVQLVEEGITRFNNQEGVFGIISANYDTELFGHWWFEGVAWLEAVIRRLAGSEVVALTTSTKYIEEYPPETAIELPAGSWGAGGDNSVWDNEDTRWMWLIIHECEARMLRAVEDQREPSPLETELLNQAARELLLLQASDWPFLVTTGQAREYAIDRFKQHVDRFERLLENRGNAAVGRDLLDETWEADKVFPGIDFRWYEA
jgi:1,4-alpha-glucan branching enzyme